MLDRTLLPCGIAWCEKQEQIVQSLATVDTANYSMTFAMALANCIGVSDNDDKILSQFGPESTPVGGCEAGNSGLFKSSGSGKVGNGQDCFLLDVVRGSIYRQHSCCLLPDNHLI
jgi:hypothetical protein